MDGVVESSLANPIDGSSAVSLDDWFTGLVVEGDVDLLHPKVRKTITSANMNADGSNVFK